MKDNSGNIKKYSAEDIRRYVQDEMSPMEMHAIEKAALEDPFLSDAIEGFSSGISEHGLASVENSAINLQTEFSERIKGKNKRNLVPVVNMKWWQAAVAASIIITAGVLGYRSYTDRAEELLLSVNDKNNKTEVEGITVDSVLPQTSTMESKNLSSKNSDTSLDIAKTDETDDNKPAAKSILNKSSEKPRDEKEEYPAPSREDRALAANERTVSIKQKANSTNQNTAAAQKDAEEQKDAAKQKAVVTQKAVPSNDKTIAINEKANAIEDRELAPAKREAAMPLKKAEESEVKKDVAANLQSDTTRSQTAAPLETKLSGKVAGVDFDSRKATNNNQSALNYFNGQIFTSDNKPLSNAVLKLNNNATTYTTDNNGKFRIASPDSVIEVEASMVGRETTRFRLQKDDIANNLLLPDVDNTLNEVVVIGYGTQRKKDITGSVTVSRREAEPEGGWLVWDKYLQTNKDSSLVLNGSAETELSFQVTAKNKLTQFRVIRSISAKHDQEVIRLVKEGPKWKLRKGKKAAVTITMRF
ncbi:carboxypeptidase-like regulatory domain-containing protein [Flavitalea sp.]|nr:carboxypeptidase-like regulatory domain-containing protein [Flavitalea sp.]